LHHSFLWPATESTVSVTVCTHVGERSTCRARILGRRDYLLWPSTTRRTSWTRCRHIFRPAAQPQISQTNHGQGLLKSAMKGLQRIQIAYRSRRCIRWWYGFGRLVGHEDAHASNGITNVNRNIALIVALMFSRQFMAATIDRASLRTVALLV
jgi:hypothetical protein